MTSLELYWIPVLIIIVLVQGTLLFIDAKKKTSFPWFWGIWGLTTFPLPTLFYLLFVVLPYRKKQKLE